MNILFLRGKTMKICICCLLLMSSVALISTVAAAEELQFPTTEEEIVNALQAPTESKGQGALFDEKPAPRSAGRQGQKPARGICSD